MDHNASSAGLLSWLTREEAAAQRAEVFKVRVSNARALRQSQAEEKLQRRLEMLRRHDVLVAARLRMERTRWWQGCVALVRLTQRWRTVFHEVRDSRDRLAAAIRFQRNWRMYKGRVYRRNVRRAAAAVGRVVWFWKLQVSGVGWGGA